MYPSVGSSRFKYLLFTVLALNFLLICWNIRYAYPWASREEQKGIHNSTLGFQKIFAVARNEAPERFAWRKSGLLKAATYTHLQIEVLKQPEWNESDVESILSKSTELRREHALAWLGHLNALKTATSFSTSLILEDDADWDVEIHSQMPQIADAVWNLTQSTPKNGLVDPQFLSYGDEWDVLWLGHCGDNIRDVPPAIQLHDTTIPPSVSSWEQRVSQGPSTTRWVHWSTGPVCTYAYAVTASGASRILTMGDHGSTNFDIWLHIRCKGGDLRCVTVNPEIFHHHTPEGGGGSMIDTKVEPGEERTDNIWHSARCNSVSQTENLVTCTGPEP